MPKFFADRSRIGDGVIVIRGDDAHHISYSLRMAVGDKIIISDGEGFDYDCVLEDFAGGEVRARIESKKNSDSELGVRVYLYQALPKGDKLDFIIQKSVECGVHSVVTFESERCVVRAKGESEQRKLERRQRIAVEAAKQCGRGIIPSVGSTLSFSEMLDVASSHDAVLFCYEGEGTVPIGAVLGELKAKSPAVRSIGLIIGSEGGFSPAEAAAAHERGFFTVGLGNRILRAETAAIFGSVCIAYEFELN